MEIEQLPQNAMDILNTFDDDLDSYVECERIISELNLIGYTVDYYLDGGLFNVVPL